MFDKIVIASDSFKGSLRSDEAGRAAAEGVRRVFPDCHTIILPVADGGEGTSEILTVALEGEMKEARVSDPLGRETVAGYGIARTARGQTAVIEMAASSGLTLISDDERNPLLTSTCGTGEMLLDAYRRGCREFLIGIGGSATNDAGTGMLEALGFRFLDKEGKEIKGCCGGKLASIHEIDDSDVHEIVREARFTVAFDVDTPFFGDEGAVMRFAAQKGADKEMMSLLEAGMKSFAEVISRKYGVRIEKIRGSGAAGGLGGAFSVFLHADMKRGIDMVLDAVGFDRMIAGADLIITGEGRIDSQSGKGKVICGVLQRAQVQGIPVIAVGGSVESGAEMEKIGFKAVYAIADPPENESDLRNAMLPETASENISATVAKALEALSPSLYRGNL